MDKKTVGLMGAVAGLATMGSAHAAAPPGPGVAEAMQASSYADLLKPVPDAVALLKADDATRVQIQRINGYVYFNYGPPPPPPYAYYQPYYPPDYRSYYPGYYYHHHHHHHHHHHDHHHDWR
jgi:hypothetical protein